MSDLNATALQLLARQHGVASIDDLITAGLGEWQVKDIVRRGGLELVVNGAYRSPSVADSELQRCAAVCRAHPELVIAGPTAGRLMNLRRLPDDRRIHVLAPPHSHPTRTRWVKAFRTPTFVESDVVERRDGIRLLALPRLALDLSRFVVGLDLDSVIEQAMKDGPHDAAEMVAAALDWLSPRRRWVQRFVDSVGRRIDGPAAESHLEVILGGRLVAAGVGGLVRQHEIFPPDHRTIRFDLALPAARWAVEIDGFPTHREVDGAGRDRRRDEAADRMGWTVRRVGPRDLGAEIETTVAWLVDDLSRARTAS